MTATYARDSSEARQMVEDLGDELDLASLANSVPETEDLLEKEDDAPIIRLINALLAEAIRENASDIHIETFERDLVVRFRVDGVMREVVRPKRQLAPLLRDAGALPGVAPRPQSTASNREVGQELGRLFACYVASGWRHLARSGLRRWIRQHSRLLEFKIRLEAHSPGKSEKKRLSDGYSLTG